MVRRASLAVVALWLASIPACRSRSASSPPPVVLDDARPPSTMDARSPIVGPLRPTEDMLRAGKRTGLGSPTERPEVATQAFVGALLAGAQPWSRVVDPRLGVFELRNIDGDRHPVPPTAGWQCGAAIERALARLTAASKARAGDEQLGYKFACINDPLDDAPPMASCAIYADADGAPGFSLVFVPDPALGLRLTGVLMGDERAIPGELRHAFDVQVARADTRCP